MTEFWEGAVCGIAGTLAVQFVVLVLTVWWFAWWVEKSDERVAKAMADDEKEDS
jgi:hypothetical protein